MLFRKCRNFLLTGTALSFGLVNSISHDRQLQLVTPDAAFSNFFIALDLPERCDGFDLESVGLLIQGVIDGVVADIQVIDDQFTTASVCPAPGMSEKRSRARFLRDGMHRMLGTYTYTGTARSRSTTRNTRLAGGTLVRNRNRTEVTRCAQAEAMAYDNVVHVDQARMAANASLAEMSSIANTTTQIKHEDAIKYVIAAMQALVRGNESTERARSMAMMTRETCIKINVSRDKQEMIELLDVAIAHEEDTKKESLAAIDAFYEVETGLIKLKKEIAEAELESRKADVNLKEQNLKVALAVLEFQTQQVTRSQKGKNQTRSEMSSNRIGDASVMVSDARNALLVATQAMEASLTDMRSINEEELNNDYAIEVVRLKVRAANSTFEWLEALAGLIELLLPPRLLDGYGLNDGGCIDKEPGVSVEVVNLANETGMFTENDCNNAFMGLGIDGESTFTSNLSSSSTIDYKEEQMLPPTTAPIYDSTKCMNQDKNLGTRFGTPEKCAAAARLDKSCHGDKIMWSATYNYVWGCRCCSANEGLSSHTLWDVYQYKEEQMLPPMMAAAQPAPTLGLTKSPTGAPTCSPTSASTARPTPPPIPTVTFKYDKVKCRKQDKNLGTIFRTPEECGAAARLDTDCGGDVIRWSDTQNHKDDCSCCSINADFSFNQTDWDIYQYK